MTDIAWQNAFYIAGTFGMWAIVLWTIILIVIMLEILTAIRRTKANIMALAWRSMAAKEMAKVKILQAIINFLS